MSIVANFAKNLAEEIFYGIVGDEVTIFLGDRFKNRDEQKRFIEALTFAINCDPDLSREAKDELTFLFKDKRFIVAFIALEKEVASGVFNPQTKAGKSPDRIQLELSWKAVTKTLSKATQAKVLERLLSVAFSAIIEALPLSEKVYYYKLDFVQRRFDKLQQAVQQDKIQSGSLSEIVIDDLNKQRVKIENDFREWCKPYLIEAAGQGPGSLTVKDRVDSHKKKIDELAIDVSVERKDEITQINNFILKEGNQWWWWQAEAWAGKTTLMAHLAKNPPPGVGVASVFIIGRQHAYSDSVAFYAYLIPQLAEIAGLSRVELPSPADIQGRVSQLNRLIKLAAVEMKLRKGKLVILVDGLDEDQGPYRGVNSIQSIANSLPRELPLNVRIIVSSRINFPLPLDTQGSSPHPLKNSAYIHTLSQSELARAARVAAEYELEQIRNLTDSQNYYGRDMLAYMSASGGWLTTHDLVQLTGKDRRSIAQILRNGVTARSFKTTKFTDEEQAYSIAHELLDQLLICEHLDEEVCPPLEQGNAAEIEEDRIRYRAERFRVLKKWRHKIASWAEKYTIKQKWSSSSPNYFCSEALADLLSSDPDLEKQALTILTDQIRMSLLRQKNGNDYQSIIQLRTYIDRVEKRITDISSKSLTNLATALHFLHHLHQPYENVPIRLPALYVLLNDEERAITLADSINEPQRHDLALFHIAISFAGIGKNNEATKIANRITHPYIKNSVLKDMAISLANVGEIDMAFQNANNITELNLQIIAFTNIVNILVKNNNINKANEIVNLILDNVSGSFYKNNALIHVAVALALVGDIDRAKKIAIGISDLDCKDDALMRIAIVLAETDNISNIEKAYEITGEIYSLGYQLRALVNVSIALEKVGRPGYIEEVLESAGNPFIFLGRVETLSDIVTTLVRTGDISYIKKAEKFTNSFDVLFIKLMLITEIAYTFADMGRFTEATNTAQIAYNYIDEDIGLDIKIEFLTRVALALAKTGTTENIAKAVKIVSEIDDLNSRAIALTDIAIILVDIDKIKEASEIAERAYATAYDSHDSNFEETNLIWVVDALANNGHVTKAVDIVRRMTYSPLRDSKRLVLALGYIVEALTKTGNIVAANKTEKLAKAIENGEIDSCSKMNAFTDISASLVSTNMVTETPKTTNMNSKEDKLKEIVKFHAENDNIIEAITIAIDISNPFYSTAALTDVICVLMNARNYEAAKIVEKLRGVVETGIIIDSCTKINTLADINALLVKTNNAIETTQSTGHKVIDPDSIDLALWRIGAALRDAGNYTAAKEIKKLSCNIFGDK
ncbi:MAG TPA: hypothetical protein PLF62_02415, partial [Clostridia bacterium]|nr:hypothetical protein [Clostridia bacterium]